ncbi:hypothetical protein EC912_102604 [Luteibacter rhizovicinus]|uniref:Uncharacterized protein n=1 Tax=Luteibacter rhizovicinus TaxID=242606 RepID=A0A4R3YXR0_9GAMM|nr:hypothetical protein [Luteibacter rhizovicinus]TCV96254.1 hypothetical protein EC912_102604 [Luteibacter rhizovicinus]
MDMPPVSTPSYDSKGYKYLKVESSERGYVDNPLECTSATESLSSMSEDTKNLLRNVNLQSIRPKELAKIIGRLYDEGHISDRASSTFFVLPADGNDPIDAVAFMAAEARKWNLDKSEYGPNTARYYARASEAATRLQDVIDVLRSESRLDVVA